MRDSGGRGALFAWFESVWKAEVDECCMAATCRWPNGQLPMAMRPLIAAAATASATELAIWTRRMQSGGVNDATETHPRLFGHAPDSSAGWVS